MTSLNEIKKQLLQAEKDVIKPLDIYHDAARRIVNIERQAFYGKESPNKRLAKIREIVSETLKEEAENEI